jgi:nucleoside-diphosphate-sugar epimerase
MKILFTGASSFTGFWFVKSLAAARHDIVCPVTRDLETYTDLRRRRVEQLKPLCRFIPHAPFGSDNFLQVLRENQFDLLCHHGAEVTDYKSAGFDALRALQNNTLNLRAVLAAAKERGLKAVVLTGTVFEPDEGRGDKPLRAFSPYGLSKAMTFQCFRYYCHEAGVPLGKFVIPNPFGPFEERRFTAYLMENWKAGQPAEVKTPDYRRDNIHVDLLAAVYAQFAGRVACLPAESSILRSQAAAEDGSAQEGLPAEALAKAGCVKANPSGYVGKQGGFARRIAREVKVRLGWACELKLAQQTDFSEPLYRANTDPAAGLVPAWSEQKAWDAYVEFYAPKQ